MLNSRITIRFYRSIKHFLKRISDLMTAPIFLALTVFGNLTIFTSAFLVFWLEKELNPKITSLLDTIWWATSTVTTVGYGDVIPITPAGRAVGLVTMIIGTALFWSFTALFAEAMLSKEIGALEIEIRDIQRILTDLKHPHSGSTATTKQLIEELEKRIQNLKKSALKTK